MEEVIHEVIKEGNLVLALLLILALFLIRGLHSDSKKRLDHFEQKIEQFQTVLGSYMHDTIMLRDKMVLFDKSIDELRHFQTEIKTMQRRKK